MPIGDMSPPEILYSLEYHFPVVRFSPDGKGDPGRKRRCRQRALAKAVNCDNRRLIERLERQLQAAGQFSVRNAPFKLPADQLEQERILCQIIDTVQVRERFFDPAPDTVAQFCRCRPGERHDKDLLHFKLFFQQQTQVQAADIPGLACTSRCLNQNTTLQRAGENIEFFRRPHDVSPDR